MLKEGLRIIAIFLLILIIIMDDFPFYSKLKDRTTQLFLGIIVLALIYYDTTFGFIMGLVILLIYYEIYKKIINEHQKQNEGTIAKPVMQEAQQCTSEIGYITDAQLLAAQNNIYDIQNFNSEIVGLENAIGPQGLHNGYDNSEKYFVY